MAHFAKLDENDFVLEILVVNNSEILDENNQENEQKGIDFLTNLTGHSRWKQTSYNSTFRKHYAMVGGKYDPTLDCFITLCPFPSWVFDTETCSWVPPVPRPIPEDNKNYYWDESTVSWVETI